MLSEINCWFPLSLVTRTHKRLHSRFYFKARGTWFIYWPLSLLVKSKNTNWFPRQALNTTTEKSRKGQRVHTKPMVFHVSSRRTRVFRNARFTQILRCVRSPLHRTSAVSSSHEGQSRCTLYPPPTHTHRAAIHHFNSNMFQDFPHGAVVEDTENAGWCSVLGE